MQRFELNVLPQVYDYATPFKRDMGFTHDWWHSRAGRVGEDPFTGKDYVQFLVNDVEIGRAEISDWLLTDNYSGVDSELAAKQIWFFEIRQDARLKGFGAEFAKSLISHYAEIPLAAFSEEADEFWRGIGWHHYPRKDGEGEPIYRNLFVSEIVGE